MAPEEGKMGPGTVFVLAAAMALPMAMSTPAPATAQAATSAQPDRAAVIKVAAGIMQRARYCTLVSVGEDGHPQARIMDAFPPEGEMVVWMATNALSRKVSEIRKDPRVTLSYFDAKTTSYVMLLGRASLVSDPADKAKRWKDAWAKLYKDRNRGDDYLLIKVTPIRLEVSAEGEGVKHDPTTWRATVIDFIPPVSRPVIRRP
jgi:general stress protein 26